MMKNLRPFLPILIIVGVGFLVFASSLKNKFVLDDASQVTNNPNVQAISNVPQLFFGSTFAGGAGLSGVYYKPLMTSSYAVIYSLFGAKQFYFHLFQLLLHLANGVLVFLILKRFLKGNLALFLALVFLVHPINSESVVYISALQEPLFFFFGSLAFLRVLKEELETFDYLIFALLIFLSLLSKETGILFLVLSAIYRFIMSEKNPASISKMKPILSEDQKTTDFRPRFSIFTKNDKFLFAVFSFVILAVYTILRFKAVGPPVSGDLPYPMMRLPLVWRILSVPKEAFYYISNVFFPRTLAVGQHWVVTKLDFGSFYMPLFACLVLAALILGLGILLFERKRELLDFSLRPAKGGASSKNTAFKIYVFFAFWFVFGLGMHLNIFPLDATAADRWFYFPMVGVLGLLGLAIQEFLIFNFEFSIKISNFKFQINKLITLTAIVMIVALSVRTIARNANWKDGLTLAEHDIKFAGDSFPLENNLAFELVNAGRWDEAEVHAKRSTELGPWWWLNWNNLGVVWRHKGMSDPIYVDKAAEAFQRGVDNTNSFYMPYENKAELLLFFKSPKEATDFIVEASKKISPSPRMLFLLAIAQYQMGNTDIAKQAVFQATQIDPTSDNANQFYQALLNDQKVSFAKPSY